jgi:twitching motility protein PilT
MKTADIDILLRTLVIKKASDLHIQVGTPPVFRVYGELLFSDLEPLTEKDVEKYMEFILTKEQRQHIEEKDQVDLSYSVPGIARFRVNIYKQRGSFSIAMRVIPFEIPTLEQLKMPEILKTLASKPHGLVLITGPTGSGKSTTLAAVIDYINSTRKAHIITIEEPLEFLHGNKMSLIDQREVGADTPNFSMALRDSLREDPDVILVGEMRDLETISNAITAAETGHLIFGTLHTNDAVQAVDRIIDVFPPHQQPQIRAQLASAIQGVVAQVLLRKKDNSGLLAATEVMTANSAVRNLIREAKTQQLYNVIQSGRQEGMHLLKDDLVRLHKEGIVEMDEIMSKIEDPRTIEPLLRSK